MAVLGPDMRRLMVEHPEISTRLVIALGRRLRETNERLARQSFQTVQSRVAAVLSELVARSAARGRGRRAGRARHRHPGRSGAAGGLLARVGQPLPGRARARRRHLPGARAPGGARPARAGAICLLRRARGRGRAGSGPAEAAAGGRGDLRRRGGRARRAGGRDRADPPRRRRLARARRCRRATSIPARRRSRPPTREVREETGVRGRARCASWARCATGTGATGARSASRSRSSCSSYLSGDTADHDDEVEEARWIDCARR